VIKACQVRFFFFSLPSFFTSSLSPQTATHQPTHKPCRSHWRPVSLAPPPVRAPDSSNQHLPGDESHASVWHAVRCALCVCVFVFVFFF
jgi:hypothetical protein